MEALKSRKFIICLLAMVSISVLTGMGVIPVEQYMESFTVILYGYLGANVFQKVLEK